MEGRAGFAWLRHRQPRSGRTRAVLRLTEWDEARRSPPSPLRPGYVCSLPGSAVSHAHRRPSGTDASAAFARRIVPAAHFLC